MCDAMYLATATECDSPRPPATPPDVPPRAEPRRDDELAAQPPEPASGLYSRYVQWRRGSAPEPTRTSEAAASATSQACAEEDDDVPWYKKRYRRFTTKL